MVPELTRVIAKHVWHDYASGEQFWAWTFLHYDHPAVILKAWINLLQYILARQHMQTDTFVTTCSLSSPTSTTRGHISLQNKKLVYSFFFTTPNCFPCHTLATSTSLPILSRVQSLSITPSPHAKLRSLHNPASFCDVSLFGLWEWSIWAVGTVIPSTPWKEVHFFGWPSILLLLYPGGMGDPHCALLLRLSLPPPSSPIPSHAL